MYCLSSSNSHNNNSGYKCQQQLQYISILISDIKAKFLLNNIYHLRKPKKYETSREPSSWYDHIVLYTSSMLVWVSLQEFRRLHTCSISVWVSEVFCRKAMWIRSLILGFLYHNKHAGVRTALKCTGRLLYGHDYYGHGYIYCLSAWDFEEQK